MPFTSGFRKNDKLADRFQILRLLCHGGMGDGYEAKELVLGDLVALKTIRREKVSDTRLIRRLKRELQLARQVTHTNVRRVFDVAHHKTPDGEEIVFFTMELLRGETLADRLRRVGRLSKQEAL